MTLPLTEHWSAIVAQLRCAPQVFLFLDFDGTLTPFVGHPDQARLAPKIREMLRCLAADPRILVGIISGRELADIEERVGLPELIYAGNHGMEIRCRELQYLQPTADAVGSVLQRMSSELRSRLQAVAGVLVEDKGLTASVHYRTVAVHDREYVRTIVEQVVDLRMDDFVRTDGHLVHEVRPRVEWNKGSAVRWILDRMAVPGSRAVYIGDDRTDEDAFAVLPNDFTVKVGASTTTHARYRVADCDEVAGVLRRLLDDSEMSRAAR